MGTNKTVCLNSATAALEMTMHVLGIGSGDEVITSAYTYTASASAAVHTGAKVVLVDTMPDSYEMDYNKLADIINAEDYNLRFIRIEENKTTCFPFGKVCAKNTRINESNLRNIEGYGAFIDVFPLTRIPDEKYWNNDKKWQTIKRIAAYSKLIRFSKSKSLKTNIGRALEFALSRCVNTEKLVRWIVKDTNKVNTYVKKNNLDYKYGVLWAKKYRYSKNVFENQVEVEFEGHMFYGTSNPDLVLKMVYGDYMKLPPKVQQIAHHYVQCWIDE